MKNIPIDLLKDERYKEYIKNSVTIEHLYETIELFEIRNAKIETELQDDGLLETI